MNNKYSIVIVMFAILSLVTSCLSDSDTNITYYDDAALTSFSLGNMKRTICTKTKSGKDTSYVTTYSAASYTFSIDHASGKIFNVDSLPKGTDLKKCLVTVNAYNSGMACLKSLTSDSLSSISSTDSLDFSQKRTIVVISNDGSYRKNYEVDIRVHRETKDSLYWEKKCSNNNIAALSNMRSVCFKGSLYVLGTDGANSKMYSSKLSDGKNWTEVKSIALGTNSSVATNGEYLYMHSGDKVYNSVDGVNWNVVADGTNIRQIITASRSEVYGLTADGKMIKSTDNGYTWNYDQLDSDEAFLPQQNVCGFSAPSLVNPDIDKVLVMGNRNVVTDTTPMVWTKVVDNSIPSETMPWMFQPFLDETWHHAPRFDHFDVARYADGALLLGSKSDAAGSTLSFLYSRDFGLNWWTDSRFTLPADMKCSTANFTMAADASNSTFWIISGESGEVWKAFYSTLTWK